MAEVSQKTKYVKLDDGVSFALVRTNPKLTTNTKLMYNGKKMYMESYASSPLLNRMDYKSVSVKQNSTFNKDIASFLAGSGLQAYNVQQNFSDVAISDSYDNQFETMYWCGAEQIDSSFYDEEIGFVAPLYLREKMPNYFLIFRIDDNLNIDNNVYNFKTDILDNAVLLKTFDLREGTVLGNYIHNYVNQESFEFDKSMYVNFSNSEVTYYGINKVDGVLEKKVESFKNELLNDNPILKDDKWFTEGFERNNLIFPYIMNIEYLFDDDSFKKDSESYEFSRYIGLYCNNIEFGEFADFSEFGLTEDDAIYYFEDNKKNLHRYIKKEKNSGDVGNSNSGDSYVIDIASKYEIKIDGKDVESFDKDLISGFENERVNCYAEPLDIYEGFINRAQYGFEILKTFEPGDWVGIEYDGHIEQYFADNKTTQDGDYDNFRFFVTKNSKINDIADALVRCVNSNKKSKFEARCVDNIVVFYSKKEGMIYNGSQNGGAKILIDVSLLHNKKISISDINNIQKVNGVDNLLFGNYYIDYFSGACYADIDKTTETYKNVFKIYTDEYVFFDVDRYLKTNNGGGRRICANMMYVDEEGKIDPEYRIVIVEDKPNDKSDDSGYDVSVSSTYQVEILDKFKPNHGVLSWFPIKDFDFDINYSSYGQYGAFADECNVLSKKIKYKKYKHKQVDPQVNTDEKSKEKNNSNISNSDSDYIYSSNRIKELARSPFVDDYGISLDTEYDYYNEQIDPNLCLLSKTTPYISKWGYFDEQKDSCENPYRLNVSKIFGVSNLSANTFLRSCDENEYTHSMPYYMTLNKQNYYKNYQYIICDEIYSIHNDKSKSSKYTMTVDETDNGYKFNSFFDCVDYWIDIFKNKDTDMFSYFFSGKKYGNRFDRKYSRLFGGNKFHNPTTLFRGVKFEVIRQYNGIEKRSSEYNGYKFSFVYIPVMNDSMVFNSTIHFVKNDTFKFIVGIIFVNTMLGTFNHNIFNGNVDYFNKGFLYGACKDIIRPENDEEYKYNLEIHQEGSDKVEYVKDVFSEIWKSNYEIGYENIFHLWVDDDGKTAVVTKTNNALNISGISDIIGEFKIGNGGIGESIKEVNVPKYYTKVYESENDKFSISWERYYEEYDTIIYGYNNFTYYGYISCEIQVSDIIFDNNILVDICYIDWKYYDENTSKGYKLDISKLYFKSDSIKNILFNIDSSDSVVSVIFYNIDEDGNKFGFNGFDDNKEYINGQECEIIFHKDGGFITIEASDTTKLEINGENGETIENLRVDIKIKDKFNNSFDSLGLKDYFSVFNQISMYNIAEYINSDYNVKYYSTVEDNKYKIRVIEPDSIEVKDIYESVPIKITQNNKSIIGSVKIKEKTNSNGKYTKIINRYSGYYNPIFNDVLYYGDYTYFKTISGIEEKIKYELPYSNTYIDYNYNDVYGEFGVIKNMYYHKTNTLKSDRILTFENPVYPIINEYALDYRDYNIFSSGWEDGYFISQDNIEDRSLCIGTSSVKNNLCMFGSKYLSLPDYIFIDTFENGSIWNDKIATDFRDNSDSEIIYKEINNRTVRYHLFIEKRLKRYLKENLLDVFIKYIGKSINIENDVNDYVEKNILKLYKVDKIYMYIKGERMRINDKMIENEYLKYVNKSNEFKIKNGFPVETLEDGVVLKDSKFSLGKINEFDRIITYNLKTGFKESFGFGVSFKRK